MIVTVSVITLAGVSGWLVLVALLPLTWTVWAWRSGTDVDRAGVRVRALLGEKRIPWSQVHGMAVESRHRVVAKLTDGAVVPLTAVTAADLPRVTAASGQELSAAEPPPAAGG